MYRSLFEIALLTLALAIPIQVLNLKIAHHFKLLDIPTARRRHDRPIPVTGGVGVILSWFVGLACFAFLQPQWFATHSQSLWMMVMCTSVLVLLGLIDDLRGLSPLWKLLVESVIATIVVLYQPEIHTICEAWSQTWNGSWGHSSGFFVWPLAILWIVGITNTVNLIDGLDGLAGGTSALVLCALTFLCFLVRIQTEFAIVLAALLIPSILGFLGYNWPPAKLFLGDNGSLPLGFLIATASLMCRPHSTSWIMMASMILMLGYPLLDTGLATLRRYRNGQPLFKADRNHLHYRIQRLGLNPKQTTTLFLSLSIYLQFTGVFINFLSPVPAACAVGVTLFSIMTLLSLIRSVEKDRVRRIFEKVIEKHSRNQTPGIPEPHTVIHLQLGPLLEVALREEQNRYQAIMDSLELLIRSVLRSEDRIFLSDQKLSVLLMRTLTSAEEKNRLIARIRDKIDAFLSLYEIQCSLASIPITTEQLVFLADRDPSEVLKKRGLKPSKKAS